IHNFIMDLEQVLKKTRFQQKRNWQWTAREKLFVIAYLKHVLGATVHGTADKFNIQPKQIWEWHNKEGELLLAQPYVKHLNTGAWPTYPNIETELAKWVQDLRNELKP
ncbi:7820_t:CDS:1, partial [Cetraspora pellucida]